MFLVPFRPKLIIFKIHEYRNFQSLSATFCPNKWWLAFVEAPASSVSIPTMKLSPFSYRRAPGTRRLTTSFMVGLLEGVVAVHSKPILKTRLISSTFSGFITFSSKLSSISLPSSTHCHAHCARDVYSSPWFAFLPVASSNRTAPKL